MIVTLLWILWMKLKALWGTREWQGHESYKLLQYKLFLENPPSLKYSLFFLLFFFVLRTISDLWLVTQYCIDWLIAFLLRIRDAATEKKLKQAPRCGTTILFIIHTEGCITIPLGNPWFISVSPSFPNVNRTKGIRNLLTSSPLSKPTFCSLSYSFENEQNLQKFSSCCFGASLNQASLKSIQVRFVKLAF